MGYWVRFIGIVLLLYIPWSFSGFSEHPDAAFGLILIIPLFYLPILITGCRLLFVSPVDKYRKVAAFFGMLFVIFTILNKLAAQQNNFTMGVDTMLISTLVGLIALIASMLPKQQITKASTFSEPEELFR